MSERNLFAPPDRLRRLQIEITTGCNLRCAGCQRTLGMEAGTWRNAHMPPDRFAAILRHAPPADAIILQGIGEPTLHPRLDELIRMTRADGRFGVTSFNTNALVRDIDDYAALKAAGLGHVSVSVDSLDPATAEAVRAGTDVARLAAAVRDLSRLFDGQVTLSIVLSRRNLAELPGLLDTLHGLGARIVEVQPLVSYAAQVEPMALSAADRARALALITAARARLPGMTILPAAALTPHGGRCRRPFHAAYVTVDGFLTPCCLTNDAALMGHASLAEHPFAVAWQSEGVRRFTASYFEREPSFCHGCAFNPSGNEPAAVPRNALALGQQALRDGDTATADDHFRRIATDPVITEALQGLGLARLMAGRPGDAIPFLKASGALAPNPRVTHNLAMALEQTGARDAAIALEQGNVTAHPHYVPSWHGLSAALDAADRRTEAAGIELSLAELASSGANQAVVDVAARRAAMLDPRHPRLVPVANRLRIAGLTDAAVHLLDARITADPTDLGAMLSRVMGALTVIHASAAEVATRRAAYLSGLAGLEEAMRGASQDALAAGAGVIGNAKPFYLSYQGHDDVEAQRQYGRVITRLSSALPPVTVPRRPSGPRIRVGFATAYFHLHSVSKLFGGWLRHLDPARFEVVGFHLGEGEDAMSAELAGHCARFLRGSMDADGWARAIAAEALDVLVYPEIGMHPLPVRLACQRLAPVQCVAWGHPVTTGLPGIDLFLSSALMEPEAADRHYTETLVRLPNLSIHYEPPPAGDGTLARGTLGLDDDAIVYLCCQSLFKYHPDDDALLVAIARQVPAARFLFIGDPAVDMNARRLRDRLAAAFAAAGLLADRHVVMTPPVPAAVFPALLRAGDVYLDSPRWSGGNTTLEAMAIGLPIITLPGPLMRGRHTAAILRAAGATAWIARSRDDYVALATRLASPAERDRARRDIIAGRSRVFGDLAPVRALEDVLAQAVRSRGARAAA